MEFFEWTSAAQSLIISLFRFGGNLGDTLENAIAQTYKISMICLGVAGGLYLICLIFGGIGMHAMAKKQGMKHSFLGFLPFANTYYAGKLAGEANFFGQKMKRAGLYAMIVEIIYVVMVAFSFAYNICMLPYHVEYIENGLTSTRLDVSLIPDDLLWLYSGGRWFSLFSSLFYFVEIILFCVVFNALYRKYYARGPFLMTFLSAVLPLRGFVLFAVRNNAPVDYNEYMRRRAEDFARRSAGYGDGYGSPYGGANGGAPNGNSHADDPFSDFGGGSGGSGGNNGDPFEEFSGGGKGGGN